jgi:hypothetical protein
MPRKAAMHRWRALLGVGATGVLESTGGLESTMVQDDPLDRVARAKEAMARLIKDRFGGDGALLQEVDRLAISGEEAIGILADPSTELTEDHFGALETIVAFDGTRPSFLVKESGIDFSSSYNTASWTTDLQPYLERLTQQISCIGRVELGEKHIGTAFLVTPTLAITNRHVAQSIAGIGDGTMQIKSNVFLDFGREDWNEKKSFDRRKVDALLFAGKDFIPPKGIDHTRLDLAVIRVTASTLAGEEGKRRLSIRQTTRAAFGASDIVAAIGYPGAAESYVPLKLQSQYEKVLARLLEGDGGAKRFAPGKPMSLEGASGLADWTIMHDATTINGNSGSPLSMVQDSAGAPSMQTIGLHYGGDWGGERTNWAHVLAMTGSAVGYGGCKTFAEFCTAEGIAL